VPALQGPIPTLDESGLKGFEVTIWHGLYAPKGTPAAVAVKTLNDAPEGRAEGPEFIKKQEGLGAVVVTDKRMEPAEHKKFVAAEIAKWGPVIKAAAVSTPTDARYQLGSGRRSARTGGFFSHPWRGVIRVPEGVRQRGKMA
jgi:hypothetical protein